MREQGGTVSKSLIILSAGDIFGTRHLPSTEQLRKVVAGSLRVVILEHYCVVINPEGEEQGLKWNENASKVASMSVHGNAVVVGSVTRGGEVVELSRWGLTAALKGAGFHK